MIYVTKSYLPPKEEFDKMISEVWESGILTNVGPKHLELEKKIEEYLSVSNVNYVTNGTIAIQLALNALGITEGEIITTPFSFIATTSTILWERCTPIFVDIEPDNFCIDVHKIERAITSKTVAILAVHVFGYPCAVEQIELIARKYNLKVIYDGAHAFGSTYKNKSLLSYGDIATCSFHATKLFHTFEGGACFCKDNKLSEKIKLLRNFGFKGEEYIMPGVNAKCTEINAGMGLINISHITEIIESRKIISNLYDYLLNNYIRLPKKIEELDYNYAYYPIIFNNEEELLSVFKALNENGIFPRRYFYPSLNKLPYIKQKYDCPVSEDISKRIACLPLYTDLDQTDVKNISNIIIKTLKK